MSINTRQRSRPYLHRCECQLSQFFLSDTLNSSGKKVSSIRKTMEKISAATKTKPKQFFQFKSFFLHGKSLSNSENSFGGSLVYAGHELLRFGVLVWRISNPIVASKSVKNLAHHEIKIIIKRVKPCWKLIDSSDFHVFAWKLICSQKCLPTFVRHFDH